jgi:hypothetical protein
MSHTVLEGVQSRGGILAWIVAEPYEKVPERASGKEEGDAREVDT